MDKNFNHLADMDNFPRALMRMQHLYILLAGLINISIGSYLRHAKDRFLFILQIIGSLLIITATLLLVYSFFTELPSSHIERPLCRNALYLILAGVLFHVLPGISNQFFKAK